MTAFISTLTILSLLFSTVDPVYADNEEAIITAAIAVLSGIGLGYSVVYDIVTAPESARKYNDSLHGAFPLRRKPTRMAVTNFGRPRFSRDALVKHAPRVFVGSRAAAGRKERKSPQVALYWSLGATLIPVSIGLLGLTASNPNTRSRVAILGIGSGVLIGPSTGHWYAEQHARGWKSLGLRAGLGAVGVLSFYLTLSLITPFGD